jgi:chlorophyll synthase
MSTPAPAAVLELLKPVTWFPPMWAFACGAVASGSARFGTVADGAGRHRAGRPAGLRHQPGGQRLVRPARRRDQRAASADPVGPHTRPLGLYIALAWTGLSLALAAALGPVAFAGGRRRSRARVALQRAAGAPQAERLVGQQRAWQSRYEGLPWVTGAAVMLGGAVPDLRTFAIAGLYSLGAHGIMTLNDFKSVEGDRAHRRGLAAGAPRPRAAPPAWPAR